MTALWATGGHGSLPYDGMGASGGRGDAGGPGAMQAGSTVASMM
jgi:hypothetical protein